MVRVLSGVPAGGVGHGTERGSVQIWEPSSRLLVMRFLGHAERDLAPLFVERMERFTAGKPGFSLFIDLGELEGYDSEIRVRATAATEGFLDRANAIHFLVRSKIVAMGISVANLALGGRLVSHSERRRFVDALESSPDAAGLAGFARRAGLDGPVARTGT